MWQSGTIVGVYFESDDCLQFISHCFGNMLISGAQVKIVEAIPTKTVVFVTIAAPGINRLQDAIDRFDGEVIV